MDPYKAQELFTQNPYKALQQLFTQNDSFKLTIDIFMN